MAADPETYRRLAKDVNVDKPGWLGYDGMLSAPAENEVFVNIGALNRPIGNLQGRIAELAKELATLKEAK